MALFGRGDDSDNLESGAYHNGYAAGIAEGKRKGRQEMVEWVEHSYWTGLSAYNIPLGDWKAQLKAWELEEEK